MCADPMRPMRCSGAPASEEKVKEGGLEVGWNSRHAACLRNGASGFQGAGRSHLRGVYSGVSPGLSWLFVPRPVMSPYVVHPHVIDDLWFFIVR